MLKIGTDYTGIGAFEQALIKLGISYKQVLACDIDKYSRKSYLANYEPPIYFPRDVYYRMIPKTPLDIYCTTPPCQAFSLAGKRQGENDKRGILFYNSHEFIQKNKPRFFLFENVKGLLSHDKDPRNTYAKYGRTFNKWLQYLGGKSINGNPVLFPISEAVPYHIYHKVLNATDYGIPQNRERVFIIGIRDDVDNHFTWPKSMPLVKRLLDILEMDVDEKYFLSDRMIANMTNWKSREKPLDKLYDEDSDSIGCLTARGQQDLHSGIKLIKVGFINQDTQCSQVFGSDGLSPSLCAGTHGYCLGYIEIKANTKKGYDVAGPQDSINFGFLSSKTRGTRVGRGVANTLDTSCTQGVIRPVQIGKSEQFQKTSKIIGDEDQPAFCIRAENPNGVLIEKEYSNEIFDDDWHQLTGVRTEEAKAIRRENLKKGEDFSPRGEKDWIPRKDGLGNTLTAAQGKEQLLTNGFRIRRLTPRECMRLMDFPDSYKINVSDSQAYKQAGNSIPVGMITAIINKLIL